MGFLAIAAICLLSSLANAWAYTPTVSQNGTPVRWKGPVRFPLAGNPVNRGGLDSRSFFEASVSALQRWKSASGGMISFDYWQGTDPAIYEPDSEYDGLSSVYFASNARGGSSLASNVLGLTQVWYNTKTGEILEADIVLNDLNYQFTDDPKDTSGYGTGRSNDGNGRRVYIENVLTHEIGHAFGLSHSGGLQSTMLFMESPEQAHLGCDEQTGIQALYPSVDAGARGAIEGTVVAGHGAPVFGAHVVAVSRRRGAVLATALTDRSGRYAIQALEPGSYILMAEPFFAGAAALPSYYAGISSRVCDGESFSRTLLSAGESNEPFAVAVAAGAVATAPELMVRCREESRAAVDIASAPSSSVSAPVIFDGTRGPVGGFGVAGTFSEVYSNAMYYRVKSAGGRVQAYAMGYSLYSPVHTSVSILDSEGREVPSERLENVYEGASGFVNYDSAALARDLPVGEYLVKISASPLGASVYPAGPLSLDTEPFFLLTGSVNEPGPPLAATVAFNARCRMDESFAEYASPPGNPERRKAQGENEEGIGFCGRLENPSSGVGGPPAPPGAIVGWLLPWLLMGLMAKLARGGLLREPPGMLP